MNPCRFGHLPIALAGIGYEQLGQYFALLHPVQVPAANVG
jgi:hypothetical protein